NTDARPFPFTPGRQRTYVITVGGSQDVLQTAANARQPLRAWTPPAESNLTEVDFPIIEIDHPAFPSWRSYVEATWQRYEANRLYGDLDFGDVQGWTPYSRSSNYHGIPHEFLNF